MQFLLCLSLIVGIGYVLGMIGIAIFSVIASFVGTTAAYIFLGMFICACLSSNKDKNHAN